MKKLITVNSKGQITYEDKALIFPTKNTKVKHPYKRPNPEYIKLSKKIEDKVKQIRYNEKAIKVLARDRDFRALSDIDRLFNNILKKFD